MGLGQRHEVAHGLDAQLRLDRENVGRCGDLRDGNEILERIVGQAVVEAGIHRIDAGGDQKRISVGLGACRAAHADIAAGAALVLHNEGAAERLLQRSRQQTGNNIRRSAR